ncbi:MAG: hypothetical protein GXO78_07975 [Calditrichaeota bacterium]|nr:hypothetical protein [Calditrichota bacterium]
MNHVIHRNNLNLSPLAENLIRRKVQKLDRLLESFNPDLVSFNIHFDRVERKDLYATRLVLELPHKTLRAEKQSRDLIQSISEAFDALWRELKQYKEFLRREPEYRRKQRPSYKEQMAEQADLKEEIKEEYLQIVLRLLRRLYNFTRREIQMNIYQGMIRPGDVLVSEVLDEAVVAVFNELPAEYDELWIERALFRKIIQIVNRKVKERRARPVPLEKKVTAVEDLDTELYEFYQPDFLLRLEDLVPDNLFPEPDKVYEEEDLKRFVQQTLSGLPEKWRQAFTLMVFEEFTPEEVAMIQGVTPEEVQKYVRYAREYLRERLKETGLELPEV